MKESWKNASVKPLAADSDKASFSIRLVFLWTILFLVVCTLCFISLRANMSHTTVADPISRLSRDKIRSLMFSVINGSHEFDEFLNDEGGKYFGKLQLLDQDYHVLWSKDLDEKSLRSLDDFMPEVEATFVGDDQGSEELAGLSVRRVREAELKESRKVKKYVVSSIQRAHYVGCDRFRPVRQGRYLVSPSIQALHTCYRSGISLREMEHGRRRVDDGRLRYDLDKLYIPCDVAFDPVHLNDLTEELADDFEDCGWSGSLDNERRLEIERRFAGVLATRVGPSSLVDPRSFVDCSHVVVEDASQSPSYEALWRCRKHGLTPGEIQRGARSRSRSKRPRNDVGGLFLSCGDLFGSRLDYLTDKLRDDYRRCKEVGAVGRKTRERIERRFRESLDG